MIQFPSFTSGNADTSPTATVSVTPPMTPTVHIGPSSPPPKNQGDRYIPTVVDRDTFHTPTNGSHYQRALREHLLGQGSSGCVLSYTQQSRSTNSTVGGGTGVMSGDLDDDTDTVVMPHNTTTPPNSAILHARATPPHSPQTWGSTSPPSMMPPAFMLSTPPQTPDRNRAATASGAATPLSSLTRTPPPRMHASPFVTGTMRHTIVRRTQINSSPSKALDAPDIKDDPACQLLDWGANNVILLVLGNVLYGWNSDSQSIDFQVGLPAEVNGVRRTVSVVRYTPDASHSLLGYCDGTVELRGSTTMRVVREYRHAPGNVTSIATHDTLAAIGTDTGAIVVTDTRSSRPVALHHSAVPLGVASLHWSPEGNHLAAGGSGGEVSLWHLASFTRPSKVLASHNGVVRAMAWSPHQRGLLATASICEGVVQFDNVLCVNHTVSRHDVGCNIYGLLWSRSVNEIITAHGGTTGGVTSPLFTNGSNNTSGTYRSQYQDEASLHPNECVVWDAREITTTSQPMKEIQRMRHLGSRVIYMSGSPDGASVVTAADETIRVWLGVFPLVRHRPKLPDWMSSSVLR